MINIPEYKNAESVFNYFEQISRIPHGSGNTTAIADYLVDFAKAHSLEYYRDSANNVLIKKGATEGYEGRPTVIIQGHTDMVCEKLPGLDKDMTVEGLNIYRDGDFLRAEGTTLGGDDGVAVAYALALLDASDIPHPPIEALFTSDEEIGLLGAAALDASVLSGKIMINVDSDEEGIFTVGCAGGCRLDISLPVSYEATKAKKYKLTVSGLLGGHSGGEINRGRGNAIKLLAEALSLIGGVRLASFNGGNADNAIPRDCTAEFASETDPSFAIEEFEKKLREIYKDTDKDVKLTLTECDFDLPMLDKSSSEKVISLVNTIKSGVIEMSADIENLPESSENIGVARLDEGRFALTVSVRSAKSGKKLELINNIKGIADAFGADFSSRGDYPAWEYKKESTVREVCCEVYRDLYGEDAQVIIIHAGLECGIFSDKIEGLDCISLGPNNYNIHTTEEHLSISSTARVWEFLKAVLVNIK